jgi:hypothetical protein
MANIDVIRAAAVEIDHRVTIADAALRAKNPPPDVIAIDYILDDFRAKVRGCIKRILNETEKEG